MNKKLKILLASDLYYAKANSTDPSNKGHLSLHFLRRLINRANRFIQPDVIILTGRIIDKVPATDLLDEIYTILKSAEMPVLIIPSNHQAIYINQGQQAAFEACINLKINEIRFDFFAFNPSSLSKMQHELLSLKKEALNSSNPMIVVHQSSLPSACHDQGAIFKTMQDAGVMLSLSANSTCSHNIDINYTKHITANALCKAPFSYDIIKIEADKEIRRVTENLKLPDQVDFYDYHIHTPLAYCNENMDIALTLELAQEFGLKVMGFAEHSGHLYCSLKDYWHSNIWYSHGLEFQGRINRGTDYFNSTAPYRNRICRIGLEVDTTSDGELLLDPADEMRLDFKLGAIHHMPECSSDVPDKELSRKLLFLSEGLLSSGVDILAHPLRVINWSSRSMPDSLPQQLALLLKKYNGIAELNFHNNQPSEEFILACLENGVKFCFGSDAHNLYEIGEFYGQLSVISKLAPNVSLSDIIASPPNPS
jgi:histidinol phosphatase-like PHP family hydrolase